MENNDVDTHIQNETNFGDKNNKEYEDDVIHNNNNCNTFKNQSITPLNYGEYKYF